MTIALILVIAALILWRRLSATRKPIQGSGIRLLLPILFLMTGFSSFMNPQIHVNALEMLIPLFGGAALSVPLILTTNYEVRENGLIYARKSVVFVVCLLVILAIRLGLRDVLQGYNTSTMMVMYFMVAFGYLVPWRVASFIKFRKVCRAHSQVKPMTV